MTEFRNGSGETTRIGYVNKNGQECLGTRGRPGNSAGQKAYKIYCLKCGHLYGANGFDIFERKCPKCQNGAAGLEF
ncbi:MAG: hypothetical protein F4Y03_16715 [Alphaproteobacteria bacterium]|nr:hypothetical protein [Alphaproteobacteria bacterium]